MNTFTSYTPKNPSPHPDPTFSSSDRTTTRLQAKLLKVISTSIERPLNETSSPFLNLLSPDRPVKPAFSTTVHSPHSPSSPTRGLDNDSSPVFNRSPLLKQAGTPLLIPIRTNSHSTAHIGSLSKGNSPDSSMITRSTKLEGKIKVKGRFGENRLGEIREKQHGREAKSGTFISPRTLGEHYDYKAQHLTFIPENMRSNAMNKTSFLKFNDLAKTMNSTHHSMLGSIVMEDVSMRRQEGQQAQGQGQEQKNDTSHKKLQTIKKMLEFNKLQKDVYDVEIYRQHKELVLPLVKKEHERQTMEKHMKSLKVSPSIPTQTQAHGWDSMILSSMIFDSVNQSVTTASEVKQRRDSKKGKNGKKENRSSETSDMTNAIKASYKFRFFWYPHDHNQTSWIPHAREGHTLTTVGKQVVLYGGFGNTTKSDIAVYYPEQNRWKQPQMRGDVPLNERHGHSACEYQNCALIFGGEERVGAEVMFREYLNDTRAFYPDTGEWKYIPCIGKNITPRRNHAAAIYERNMYVYGGVTVEGERLNDVWKLNLRTFTWTEVVLGGVPQDGLANHCMCACYAERYLQKIRVSNKSYEEGLYVFGGKDNEGRITNTLKYLDPNNKTPQWKYPSTKGVPPSERINHTMLFFQPLGILIIYGGKNGMFREQEKIRDLNDIRILNLETMSWNASSSYGDLPKMTRASHAASVYGNLMIIFGGLGEREYMPNETRLVELSQTNAQRLANEYGQREKDTSMNNRVSEFLPTFSDGSPVNFRRNDGSFVRRTKKEETWSSLIPSPLEYSVEKTGKKKEGKEKESANKIKNSFG